MTVKCVRLTVAIHGLDADADALDFLKGWIREETRAGLLGHQRDRFRFRDGDGDIEVFIDDAIDSYVTTNGDRQ